MTILNISKQDIQGKCDLKCYFQFDYKNTNLVARNDNVMISLRPDNNSSQVKYNNESYEVTKIYITSPSIHSFQGKPAEGEIIVEHNPILGGNTLSVAVPFVSSAETTTASKLITSIIEKVATNAPNKGETVNINTSDFTLQDIIPKKPFYTYTTKSMDWIVYDIYDAIPLTNNTLSTLNTIVSPYTISSGENSSSLYYNSIGPNQSTLNEEGIYISCSPTGSSTTESEVEYNKDTTNYDLGKIFNKNSIIFQIILAFMLILLCLYLLSVGYTYIVSGAKTANKVNVNPPLKS
jgi:carbonic anhydrase